MKESTKKEDIRKKIIGLGKDSLRKSYYPQLREHIKQLEIQKNVAEEKNKALIDTLKKLESTKEHLQISEARFRTLFNNANDAIFIQNDALIITDCNEAALKLFNTPKENLVGKPPSIFIPDTLKNSEELRESAIKKMKLALAGTPQVFELSPLSNIVGQKQILIALNSFELNGKQFLQAIVHDTTELKRLQQELLNATIKTEEQERARFAKELHDGVGPILSTIKLYFQWLSETDDSAQREVIIEKGNKNISEAIKALKEVSNNLSPHILSNYGLIEGLTQFIERITATGKIDITLESNLKKRIYHDLELTLYRIITELINNTIKHAKASLIEVKVFRTKAKLQIKYTDNGQGMTINKTEKSKGLGLFNIQNRVQNINGNFKMNSSPGNGFEVEIDVNL